MFDFDLFVIGAGSGGVRASRMAAATGAKVAIAEEYRYGGTCVIRGCVPKKLFSYASHLPEEVALADGYGFDIELKSFSWAKLMANKNAEIDRLEGIYDKLLGNAGVQTIFGRAVVTGANEVEVAGKKYTAERILVATGGRPTKPNIPGAEHGSTSNDVFELSELPKRIAVYGAGYIAVEFAGIFNGLGSETRLIYRGDKVLRGFDEEVREFLGAQMVKKGVLLQLNTEITSVDKNDDGSLILTMADGSSETVDMLLFATGRGANTNGLGLEQAGVELDKRGAVKVDDYFQSSISSIYALGDVIDRVQLTPVAIGEAMCLVDTLYKNVPRTMDYDYNPTAVFSNPQIGTVGLSEEEAQKKFPRGEIYTSTFRPMKFTLPKHDEQCLMKLIVDADSRKVVGAHIVGIDSAEMTQALGIAMKMGATKEDFDATVGIHPTSAEEFVTMRDVKRTWG